MGIHLQEASHLQGLGGRHQYLDSRFSRIRAPCVASTAAGTEGEEKQMARSSKLREQLTEEGREAGSTGPRTDPCGTPRWTQKERLL